MSVSKYISLHKLEYAGLLLCMLVLAVGSYRLQVVSFGIPIVLSIYFLCKNLYDIRNFTILWPLIGLLIMGSIGLLGKGYHLIHVFRDLAYFSSPITAFILGFYLQKYFSREKFFLIIVLFGTLYSLVYLAQTVWEFNTLFVTEFGEVRLTIGTGTPWPILALVFILLGSKYLQQYNFKMFYLPIILINILTFYYFSSRVYYFTILLFFLPLFYDTLMLKYKKVGKYLFIFFLLFLSVVIYELLQGDNFVAEKMRNSLSEMFLQSFDDYEEVIHNWRAYELFEVFRTFTGASLWDKVMGFGFGKTVQLEFELLMPFLALSEIPIFHNGFGYVLLKTGMIGVSLFVLFFVCLWLKGRKYYLFSKKYKFEYSILISCILSLNFSTLVVNGFFSGESCILTIISSYMYFFLKNSSQNEISKHNNSNI